MERFLISVRMRVVERIETKTMPPTKNWEEICRNLSSGSDSDAYDDLNVLSVTKNAKRVAELMHTFVPGWTPRVGVIPPRE